MVLTVHRIHVLDDLQPYVCPCIECTDGDLTYARKRDFHRNLTSNHFFNDYERCPFCDKTIPLYPQEIEPSMIFWSMPPVLKHICRHMEEITFAVVSTAHDTWSYVGTEGLGSSGDRPPSIDLDPYYGEQMLLEYSKGEYAEDERYSKHFWTGISTPVSSGSSANTPLRDPYPADYLESRSNHSGDYCLPAEVSKRQSTESPNESNYAFDTIAAVDHGLTENSPHDDHIKDLERFKRKVQELLLKQKRPGQSTSNAREDGKELNIHPEILRG